LALAHSWSASWWNNVAFANDSLLLTPGSGATLATHLKNSKEHEVIMLARASGHVQGIEEWYFFQTNASALFAAANSLWFDMFNADAALVVRILGLWHLSMVEAGGGATGLRWEVSSTTAVGTGGTALTAWKADENDGALDVDITARLKATGGATIDRSLFWKDEGISTSTSTFHWGKQLRSWLPAGLDLGKGLVLRQNRGFRIQQQTAGNTGNFASTLVGFVVE